MYLLIVFLPLLGSSVAGFFGRFLGSEGTAIMTTPPNLVFFGIFLFIFIFIFRFYSKKINKKSFRLGFFMHLSLLFLISFLFFFMRLYLLSRLGLLFELCFAHLIFLSVVAGPGLPLPAPSDPSSSSSWSEDSFELEVLSEPFPEASIISTNKSDEVSLKNRILSLENQDCIFLMDKAKGEYWTEIKNALDQAPSQKEYIRLIEFENRDLQIRERKHSCFSLFQQVLSQEPDLAENAPYNPTEAFIDFFSEKRDELDNGDKKKDELGRQKEFDSAGRDRKEIEFLGRVEQDIRKYRSDSIYIKQILRRVLNY
ncbi:hypothetical protein NE237_014206 [Protea cynaroides]|uniref:Uncharacterized protein n=1 Tax=Protea cynaroides TaxID=273540 RepID=A0A9Q0GKA1_9MAGN|nr:hypothetical protein NE237_014206 [Protea cynaroides]